MPKGKLKLKWARFAEANVLHLALPFRVIEYGSGGQARAYLDLADSMGSVDISGLLPSVAQAKRACEKLASCILGAMK